MSTQLEWSITRRSTSSGTRSSSSGSRPPYGTRECPAGAGPRAPTIRYSCHRAPGDDWAVPAGTAARSAPGAGPPVRRTCPDVQIHIWFPNAEFPKEEAAQAVVVVLSGVNQAMVGVPVEKADHEAEPDDLGPRSEDRHHFQRLDRRVPPVHGPQWNVRWPPTRAPGPERGRVSGGVPSCPPDSAAWRCGTKLSASLMRASPCSKYLP